MKTISPSTLPLYHDEKKHRFHFRLDGGKDARLEYRMHKHRTPQVVDFTHTFVPEEFREMGIASELVEKSIQHAKKSGYHVHATCPFVAWYLSHHPEYNEIRWEMAQGAR